MSKYVAAYSCQINEEKRPRVTFDLDDDERVRFDRLFNELCRWNEEHQVYRIFSAQTLNILLMGKISSGKTMISEVLQNPSRISSDAKLYSRTKEISISSFAVQMDEAKRNICCFNFIDTPDLFHKSLKTKQLKRTLKKCLDEDLTRIHLFAFVINLQTNIDEDQIQSMRFLRQSYFHLSRFCCLIVTHAEESHAHERQKKLDEFFHSEPIVEYDLKELFEERIFFIASLRSQLHSHPNRQALQQQMNNVIEMRNAFLRFLTELDPQEYFPIQSLNHPHTCHLF